MGRITLYGWLNYEPKLFDNIVLPEGIDKPTLINEIIKNGGDLYTYHQALQPLIQNINFWFSRRSYDFEMMYKALRATYSPIENYDRKEEVSRRHEASGTDTNRNSNDAVTNSGLQRTETLSDASTQNDRVSAYNAADFQNSSQTELNKSASTSSSDTTTSSANSNTVSSTTYGSAYDEVENNRIHGNIGVTKTQEMISSEIEMRAALDLYKIIAMEFEKEFLIQVY